MWPFFPEIYRMIFVLLISFTPRESKKFSWSNKLFYQNKMVLTAQHLRELTAQEHPLTGNTLESHPRA